MVLQEIRMHVIRARNVHQAIPEGLRYLSNHGVWRESRNSATLGSVLVAPGPVATVYLKPLERVEMWPQRDSNPTFHLMESLWMLAGRRDVAYPSQFNSTFGQFSDDGWTFNGAYGFRWRNFFGMDQLERIAHALRANPDDRRQVLAMWDVTNDLGSASKDIPCNTHVYFGRGAGGELNMTVCCRSNDAIWGAYGSNAVHFAFLLEFMAGWIGCPVGTYTQMSNNFHVYSKTFEPVKMLVEEAGLSSSNPTTAVTWCPYRDQGVEPFPLLGPGESAEQFTSELRLFLDEGLVPGIQSVFLRKVAWPLTQAYTAFSERDNPNRFMEAASLACMCEASDWRLAVLRWLERKRKKAAAKVNA